MCGTGFLPVNIPLNLPKSVLVPQIARAHKAVLCRLTRSLTVASPLGAMAHYAASYAMLLATPLPFFHFDLHSLGAVDVGLGNCEFDDARLERG